MNESKAVENRALFLAWLRQTFPDEYSAALNALPSADHVTPIALSGFLDSIGNAFNRVVTGVTNNLPQLTAAYSTYQAQRELLKINAERARAGQAPLTFNDQGQLVSAGGLSYTQDEYRIAQSSGLSTVEWLAIGGAFALMLFLIVKK